MKEKTRKKGEGKEGRKGENKEKGRRRVTQDNNNPFQKIHKIQLFINHCSKLVIFTLCEHRMIHIKQTFK